MNRIRARRAGSQVGVREEVHRRAALTAIACLILLGTSPVIGHHLSQPLGALLAGHDHLGAICLTALRLLLGPVHGLFHVLLMLGLVYAFGDRIRAGRLARRTLGPIEAVAAPPDERFASAARAAGIECARIRVVPGLPNPAFTVGWLRPRIYVAEELAERLSPDELAGVLAHEGAHVRRRDPLRLSLLRFLGCALFWIPALRRLADDVADDVEIAADEAAAGERPLMLATALLSLARSCQASPPLPGTSVGFYRLELLERRIRRLAGEAPPIDTHVTRRSLGLAGAALVLAWISGAVMMYAPSAREHCEHRGVAAVKHVFSAAALAQEPRPLPQTDLATGRR